MKHLLVLISTLFLSGCWLTTHTSKMPFGAMPLTVVAAGEAVSWLATDKFLSDHVSSLATGKDCSLSRKLSGEGKYCMTELEIERANRPVWSVQKTYCYGSLASATCYDRPSPNPADRLIGVYEKPVYPVKTPD